MTTNRPEFKAHDDFIFKHKKIGRVTREEFIQYIRSSHEHMRKLSEIIQQYNQTIDDYLDEWDGRFESFDEDVKDLLHLWIQDGTMDHIINENLMSSKADKSYVDDLNENVTAQLAQKANKGDIGLADLNKNKTKYDASWFSDDFLTDLSNNEINTTFLEDDSVTSNKIADKAVEDKHISFVENNNLFNGRYTRGRLVGGTDAAFWSHPDLTTLDDKSVVLAIKPNTTYSITKEPSDRFRVALFNGFPSHETYVDDYVKNNDVEGAYTFSTSASHTHVVITVSISGQEPKLHIEEGEEAHDLNQLNIKRELLADNIEQGKNLFDGTYVGASITGNSEQGGRFRLNEGRKSAVVKIKPNSHYAISKTESNRFRVALVERYPTENTLVKFIKDSEGNENEYSFTTGENDNYVVVYVAYDDEPPTFMQIEESSQPTSWETYGYKFSPQATSVNGDGGGQPVAPDRNSVQKLEHFLTADNSSYKPISEFEDMSLSNVTDSQLLYDKYNQLMNENTSYVSRKEIGKSTNNKPVYAYTFKTPGIGYKPKIFVSGGIHGHENQSIIGAYRFFKDLVLNWRELEALKYLRANIEIVFVPLINPDGYELNQRHNANDVDLNRNFPQGFGVADHQGTHGASEIETQNILNYMDENKDIFFMLDIHNKGNFIEGQALMYSASNTEVVGNLMIGYSNTLDQEIRLNHPTFEDKNYYLAEYSNGTVNGGHVGQWENSAGIKGLLLEINRSLAGNEGGLPEETQDFNAMVIGNYILAVARTVDLFI